MPVYVRFGEITAPIDLDCEFCKRITPAGDKIYTQEVQVDRADKKREQVIAQYMTLCRPCYDDVKQSALKFKIPIRWDQAPEEAKLAVGFKELQA